MGVRDVTGYLGIATILSNIHPRKTTVSKPAEGLKVEVSMNKARVTKAGETERVCWEAETHHDSQKIQWHSCLTQFMTNISSYNSDSKATNGPRMYRNPQRSLKRSIWKAEGGSSGQKVSTPTVLFKLFREGIKFPADSWDWVLGYWGKKHVNEWT